jgi:carboxyl-terminal processing protease
MASKRKKETFKDAILKRWKIASKVNKKEISNSKQEKKNGEKIQKRSTFSTAEVVTIVIITAFISLLMGLVISNSTNQTGNYKAVSPEMQDFLEEYNNIIDNYYDDVDEKELLDAALESVIDSLGDPYIGVVDDSLANSLSTRLQGTYSGFGIEIANNSENYIYIVNVIEDTPAEKVGLQLYDKIIAMDGVDVTNTSTTDFVTMVKKNTNQVIKLTILREGVEMNIDITREKITLKSVSSTTYEVDNKKIGYIYISVFAANTDSQFSEALATLEESGIDSLIIDLRDNTGGHLTAVENMMSEFFDKTHIIYQIQDKKDVTKYYSTGKETKGYPIAVLVNGNSASASEMLTAALQEEYGATVIGTNTYGKGTVQEVQSTNSGVQYKLTTKKWLTPKGNWVNGVGISPDVEVKLDESYFSNPTEDNDNQLQAAFDTLTK